MEDNTQVQAVNETSPVSNQDAAFNELVQKETGYSTEPEVQQSNTPDEQDEILSEKAQKRFQKLANENKYLLEQISQYEQELQQQRQLQAQLAEYLNATYNQEDQNAPQVYNPEIERLVLQNALELEKIKLEKQALEQQKAWDEVMNSYPEVKDDVNLDNLIYSTYKTMIDNGVKTTPKQVADHVMSYLNEFKSRISEDSYAKAEENLSQAMQGSVKVNKNLGNANEGVKGLLDRAKSGDEGAILELMDKGLI